MLLLLESSEPLILREPLPNEVPAGPAKQEVFQLFAHALLSTSSYAMKYRHGVLYTNPIQSNPIQLPFKMTSSIFGLGEMYTTQYLGTILHLKIFRFHGETRYHGRRQKNSIASGKFSTFNCYTCKEGMNIGAPILTPLLLAAIQCPSSWTTCFTQGRGINRSIRHMTCEVKL